MVVICYYFAFVEFCTPWPKGVSYASNITKEIVKPEKLERHLKCQKKLKKKMKYYPLNNPDPKQVSTDPGYFPLIVTKSTYLYSGPSVRDIRARVATVKVRAIPYKLV